MEVSPIGKYILYSDYLEFKDNVSERELNGANAYHELERTVNALLTKIKRMEDDN